MADDRMVDNVHHFCYDIDEQREWQLKNDTMALVTAGGPWLKVIKDAQRRRAEKFRKEGRVKTGDIIFVHGSGLLAKIIMKAQAFQTKDGKASNWSHVALALDDLYVIESTLDLYGNGIRISPKEKFSGNLLVSPNFSQWGLDTVAEHAKHLYKCGKTYPVAGLIGSLLSFRLGWSSNPLQTKDSLYCSAFIQECFAPLNVDFDPNRTARNTSPEMIWRYAEENNWTKGVV